MMDDSREHVDDAALDALIAQAVRVSAPEGFAVRVYSALDEQSSRTSSRGWLRPALAAAAVLLVAAIWWWRQPVPVKSEAVREAHVSASAPVAPDAPVAPVVPHVSVAPVVPDVSVAPVAPAAPVLVRIDHERALNALDAVPAVQQAAIDPAAIGTPTIDVNPPAAIPPLNVDTTGPDPGAQGDH
jgi:hypothetical protein